MVLSNSGNGIKVCSNSLVSLIFSVCSLLYSSEIFSNEQEDIFRSILFSNPTYIENGERYFVIDGDILMDEIEGIRLISERNDALALREEYIEKYGDKPTAELAVMVHDGKLATWPTDKKFLSWRIEETGFTSSQIKELKLSIAEAATDWNNACSLCRISISTMNHVAHSAPDFLVKYVTTKSFIAAAFFPHHPIQRRYLRISPSFFSQQQFDSVGILRHELGHILGYRHEHIRHPSLQECKYEDANWVALTEIDPQSVMHYLCDSKGNPNLVLTDLDKNGHLQLYGAQ